MKRLVACIILLAAAAPSIVPTAAVAAPRRPNVVIVMLDDVRADLITPEAAPTITNRVMGRGVVFGRAIVPVSLCCPSRASTLTGNHAHTTGVYKGIGTFRDDRTVAVWLDDAGYRTGLFGKYLNGYGRGRWAGYVPPGWDRWTAFRQPGFTGYDWFDRAGRLHAGTRYSTAFLVRRAKRFIRSTPRRAPLFLYFAPYTVHEPTEPAPRDVGAFAHLEPWRPPSYDVDPHQQPPYLDREWTPAQAAQVDDRRIAQHETLLSADRAVGTILDALARTGRRRDSVVIVMSDNGFMWGEHRLTGKNAPYDTSSRIPLALRYDTAGWTGSRAGVVANIDLAPTIARLTHVDHPATEGVSLLPMLRTGSGVRDALLLEHKGAGGPESIPSFCGVRTRHHLFVHYTDGFEELYDYRVDPWELDNIARDDPGFTATFRRRTRELCDPVPPGFAW
ncbi:MAG: sulfatase-like hydrolase/transferase [Actinomycetota bacterium]